MLVHRYAVLKVQSTFPRPKGPKNRHNARRSTHLSMVQRNHEETHSAPWQQNRERADNQTLDGEYPTITTSDDRGIYKPSN